MTAIVVALVLLSQHPAWRELQIKANQYVAINIPKNWGVRLAALELTQSVLARLPAPQLIAFERDTNPAGFSASKPSLPAYALLGDQQPLRWVDSSASLRAAMLAAKPGDWIVLRPGKYPIDKRLSLGRAGTAAQPIRLLAQHPGQSVLQIQVAEGIYLDQAHWHIEGLIFKGQCQSDAHCEHAIHFYGDGDHVTLQNNQFIDFNAALKANGNYSSQPAKFADHVTVTANDFFNTRVRQTTTPSSPIDVVGGNHWQITNNFIADFSRQVRGKPSVTYGAFLKGGGEHGVIADNVVNCAWRLPYQNALDVRVGLSLGNGGTEAAFCQSAGCQAEHKQGQISGNLVLNCLNDVSIYLNKASATRISDNLLLNSLGIDARYPATSVSIVNNQIEGRVKARDGAFIHAKDNAMVTP